MGRRAVVTVEQIVDALMLVDDPHVPLSIVRMGMLDSVNVSDTGAVEIVMRMPCLSCPGVAVLESKIAAALSSFEGITAVKVDFGWARPWNVELVEPEARAVMKEHGLLL